MMQTRFYNTIGCKEFEGVSPLSRRESIRVGALGAGLSLSSLLRHEALAKETPHTGSTVKRNHSIIILWMRGGPSQIDTWDPKPNAPSEIRGEFSTIATQVPGIQLSEHVPEMARMMNSWSVIRSMHYRSEDGRTDHSTGDQVCFTGYSSGPAPDQNIHPSIGSVVRKQLYRPGDLPAYVMVPRMVPGTASSYLGASCAPFETQADPASNEPFVVPNLGLDNGLSIDRISSRRKLLGDMDHLRRCVDTDGRMNAVDDFSRQAFEMVTNNKARQAFDLESEPRSVRNRYGFFPQYTPRMRAAGDCPQWPQRMLLARRLIEAGVRLVTVDCRWWDTHDDNFHALKTAFLPQFDRAYSALLGDLQERGLLETTMVVAWGEMGRSPRISSTAGRDHWPGCFSAAMAGGGIRGGRVVGSSDHHAALPKDNPKIVQDVLATLYRHVGVDVSRHYSDHAGRPHPVLPCGEPIHELF